MQSFLKTAVLAVCCAAPAAWAQNSVTVVSPTDGSIVAVEQFPASVPVTLDVSFINAGNGSCQNNAVTELTVTSALLPSGAPVTIYGPQKPVFDQTDTCPGKLSFDWVVSSAGTYILEATAKRGAAVEVVDDVEVTIKIDMVVSVEYPAPPAIANAYINSSDTLKKLQAKRRGCIISKIATEHGQNERYGAKPGPYNDGLVRSDVDSLLGC